MCSRPPAMHPAAARLPANPPPQGLADATWVFMGWEGVEARRRGIKLNAFRLADYGVPYGWPELLIAHADTLWWATACAALRHACMQTLRHAVHEALGMRLHAVTARSASLRGEAEQQQAGASQLGVRVWCGLRGRMLAAVGGAGGRGGRAGV